jgi:hypothetical protein
MWLVNRINSNSDLFSLFQNFNHPKWRNGVLYNRVYYYQVKLFSESPKNESFLDDFEALTRERRFRAQVLQNRTVVREFRFRALLCGREMSF